MTAFGVDTDDGDLVLSLTPAEALMRELVSHKRRFPSERPPRSEDRIFGFCGTSQEGVTG
eukprot:CAMPEP_0177751956 /NCGR_PEP_ID=MMETSP0491_2-20121128/662_1 /TAXON_ID=63592 /ORGANISM="Tetraselmis chuii, Strain PLY429" /LENGTH=59 /DNA_ID=CAMNT_0019267127 /DNA_START=256 /DNA_END=431 /DNA_ORIENTATION=+